MARHLIVTWDGAGNLVSTLGIARRLVSDGHDVRVLGHPSIEARCGSHGWRFVPFRHSVAFDNTMEAEPGDEVATLTRDLWCSRRPGDDLRDELDREPADVLLVDCMLWGALSVGQASGLPTVALFHAPVSLFRAGPMVDLLASGVESIQAHRAELGLAPIEALSDVHDACDLALVATAREFDVPVPLPDNVRFVGPILDGPPLTSDVARVEPPDGDDPLVLVSFSTSYQGQQAALQQVADALSGLPVRAIVTTGPSIEPSSIGAGPNVAVVGYAPHDRLLADAAVVVTHAGLGTVMAALAAGRPLVCMPMGRDQFFNAAMVERLGAGTVLGGDADAATIAAGIQEVLASPDRRVAAEDFAAVLAGYGGAADAVGALEKLAVG